ncbi:MAG: tetratricopeptide repeat protein [Alphaproteobacteria bacterium]|nr:tetratricopeptide repeat protein [Alphaproteobacteria bacterium]MBU1514415.1 tetratricopeptide repeat protein [Alphaproteobacteria bacterium]MBU2096059.1 tetratricopeptide repeat protein [Alphaproteobacteria bacterium]MBU2150101.1 tetratricopeptide repeat protein [Alphaproteobacteria bacterium]MBU2308614.1 tetratricopeptide repeat protein [Alphaproteobacteria bacterium]
MNTFRIMLLAGVFAGVATAGAMAAGSGGGGGGAEMPSASGPRYDAAQEYAKAVASIQAKDYKTAARSAQHVTDAAPASLDGWKLLGVAQSGAENWKGARKAYERAVKLSPDDLPSRAGLGLALANLKDPKAQDQLTWLKAKAADCGAGCDAATLKSLTAEVERAVGGGTAAGQPSAALEAGSLLFAAAGDQAYVQAVSLINEKRYDEALAELDAARTAFGPHPDILTYQGYTWRKKGQFDRAEGYYKQALALAPDHRGATEYYGELKVERGDTAGAKAMLAKLDHICAYGCAEAEELRRWIDVGGQPGS